MRPDEVVALDSERDQDFRLRVGPGDLVVKIANAAESPAILDFEVRAPPARPVPRSPPMVFDAGDAARLL